MAGRATQERTLGAILGLGIGDALGMPVIGRSSAEIASEFGAIDNYHGRTFADGAELAPGEFTDETEIALCIMETYTSANGDLDPDLPSSAEQCLDVLRETTATVADTRKQKGVADAASIR